jgi:anoctamin-1
LYYPYNPRFQATYVFDNYATIAFTVVMSLWMTVFLELWKRYHAELAYRWNVLGYEPDEVGKSKLLG